MTASSTLVFETGPLNAALKVVLAAVARRNTIPILSNVLLEAAADGVATLVATNLDIIVRRKLKAVSVDAPVKFTLDAQRLSDVLGTFDQGSQTTIEYDGKAAVLKSGRAKVRFATLPAADFPQLVQKDQQAGFTIDPVALARGFNAVRHAISTEETRYYLNGVFWHVRGGRLMYAATDGHRLAHHVDALPDGAKGMPDVILRRDFVDIMRSATDDSDAMIDVKVSAATVTMTCGDFSIVAKVIDGTYPAYERVIPTDIKFDAVIDRDALDGALARVGAATNDKVRSVRVDFSRTSARVSVSSAEHGDAVDELPCEFTGDTLTLAFNLRYFRDALAALPVDTIKIGLIDPAAPTKITSITSDDLTIILMPMRV